MGIGLLEQMIEYCDQMYSNYQCDDCTGHNCNHNCKECLDDIHFHTNRIRRSYDCEKLLYYYLCRYSMKYSSEIVYALERVDLGRYPYFNILSLGCGGAADLMAFDCCTDSDDDIYYHGVDINTYWNDIHSKISEIYPHASFTTGFDVKTDIPTLSSESYNVVIIEYLISYLYSRFSSVVSNLFDDIIEYIVSNKPHDSPMLIIINDVDSINTGRDTFKRLAEKLEDLGYDITVQKFRFKSDAYYSGSTQYPSNQNLFECVWEFQQKYCVALRCESAQMLIEIE
mgnify:CR=1 FL=1